MLDQKLASLNQRQENIHICFFDYLKGTYRVEEFKGAFFENIYIAHTLTGASQIKNHICRLKMDGDEPAKTMDKGANSAIRNTDGLDGIHEASHQAVIKPPFSFHQAFITKEGLASPGGIPSAGRHRELGPLPSTKKDQLESSLPKRELLVVRLKRLEAH